MSEEKRTDRRKFLKQMALASLAAPLVLQAVAQEGTMGGGAPMGHGHGAGAMASGALPDIGPDVVPATPIPWESGECAFCGMTVVTPPDGPNPPGYRERTYGQIRLAPDHEVNGQHTLHYESLACMFNHAYTRNIVDGHGATFYVADLTAPPATADDLLLARDAAFLWAERLNVSMRARLGAFPNRAVLEVYLAHEPLGRYHVHTSAALADLAPLPEGGLLGLLNRHTD